MRYDKRIQTKILIEFCIAMIILGVLFAVAFPKFLNAQLRSKIALTYQRLDRMRMAINAYRLEHDVLLLPEHGRDAYFRLTYPVPYLDSIDPFMEERRDGPFLTLIDIMFLGYDLYHGKKVKPEEERDLVIHGYRYPLTHYVLFSFGPSQIDCIGFSNDPDHFDADVTDYCPSNGMNSVGSLFAIDSGII